MEILNKENIQCTFDYLAALTDEGLEEEIDKSVGFLYDELKGYIEGAVYSALPTGATMGNSARLDYAFGNFKFLLSEKYRRVFIKRGKLPTEEKMKN